MVNGATRCKERIALSCCERQHVSVAQDKRVWTDATKHGNVSTPTLAEAVARRRSWPRILLRHTDRQYAATPRRNKQTFIGRAYVPEQRSRTSVLLGTTNQRRYRTWRVGTADDTAPGTAPSRRRRGRGSGSEEPRKRFVKGDKWRWRADRAAAPRVGHYTSPHDSLAWPQQRMHHRRCLRRVRRTMMNRGAVACGE